MTTQRLTQQVNFILEIDRLKTILRRTRLIGEDRHENSAEHSWHIAVMAILLAEYANVFVVGLIGATLFFGGWDVPFTRWDETPGLAQTVVTGLAMFAKVFAGIFVVMWVRWTLPRFRYDQLMALGWKFMLPVALGYIILTTLAIVVVERLLPGGSARVHQLVLFGFNLLLGWVVFFLLDRGVIVSGSSRSAAGPGSLEGAPGAEVLS